MTYGRITSSFRSPFRKTPTGRRCPASTGAPRPGTPARSCPAPRRRDREPQPAQPPGDLPGRLQRGHPAVEIDPVETRDLQAHVPGGDISQCDRTLRHDTLRNHAYGCQDEPARAVMPAELPTSTVRGGPSLESSPRTRPPRRPAPAINPDERSGLGGPTQWFINTVAQSASTMIVASSGVITLGFHPRIEAAWDASPISESTSVGRR